MTASKFANLEHNAIDDIDAAIFSGDTFMNLDNIAAFRSYISRWERELKRNEIILLIEENHE
jgi:hypothetical protein